MKRAITILGTLVMMAGFCLAASAANATTVTMNGVKCTTYSNSGPYWPAVAGQNTYWYCGYRSAESTSVMGALTALANPTNATLKNAGTVVYVFAYVQDADAFLGESKQAEQSGSGDTYGGWTEYTNNRIVVLEGQRSGPVVVYHPQATNAETAHHE